MPTKETWVEKFREKFLNPDKFSSKGILNPIYENGRLGYMIKDMIAFISSILARQKEEIVKSLEEEKYNTFERIGYTGERIVRDNALDTAINIVKNKEV